MDRFLNNLKIARKFALLGAMVTILVAGPLAMLGAVEFKLIRHERAELRAMEPVRELIQLSRLTQMHRGLSGPALSGDVAAQTKREAVRADTDQALGRIKAATEGLDSAKLQARLEEIDKRWRELTEAIGRKSIAAPQSFSLHTALIESQLEAIEDVAEASGLAFDPKAASHYLMVETTKTLPALAETLAQTRGRGTQYLAKGEITVEQKVALGAQAAVMQSLLKDARSGMERAASADEVMTKRLEKPVQEALAAAEQSFKLVNDKLLQATALDYPATQFFSDMTPGVDAQFALINASLQELESLISARLAEDQRQLAASCVFAFLGMALICVLAVKIARTTTGGINEAVAAAHALAEGDLTGTLTPKGRDEVGQLLEAMQQMRNSLRRVVGEVRANAESVASCSSQIAQGNQDLSGRTEAQASALQQTAATMEELGSTVTHNANNAQEARQLAQVASGVAVRGGEVVGQVVQTMKGISESSHKIAEIIGTIDGIAFQTNILALNAAVEAARAGEQGRGFAVVASEVRMLAQRSAEAAKEIKTLISASVERVEQGTAQVDQAGRTMDEVVSSIRRVTDIVGEISVASSEQSSGVGQVGQAVSQLDQATQQNAALVEESAAAAESLKEQAHSLVQVVSVFKLAH